MKILITMLLTFFVAGAAYSYFYTPPDSCLQLVCPNDYDPNTGEGTSNPDSVMVDSCNNSPTYTKWFAKKYFFIQFKPQYYPFDIVLKTDSTKRVSDISSSKPDLKKQLEQLESELGTIYFHGHIYDEPDSVVMDNPVLRFSFERYQDYNYIIELFKDRIDSCLIVDYAVRVMILVNVIENFEGLSNNSYNFYPNPVIDKMYFNFPKESINEKIRIYSMNGQKIYETIYQKVIDVSFLPPGTYLVRIGDKAGKFIKF
jgi:hypothetical protein